MPKAARQSRVPRRNGRVDPQVNSEASRTGEHSEYPRTGRDDQRCASEARNHANSQRSLRTRGNPGFGKEDGEILGPAFAKLSGSCGTCGCGRRRRRSENDSCGRSFSRRGRVLRLPECRRRPRRGRRRLHKPLGESECIGRWRRRWANGDRSPSTEDIAAPVPRRLRAASPSPRSDRDLLGRIGEHFRPILLRFFRQRRASDPGRWTVSASVNRSHWPRAWRAPVVTALFLPVQPAGSGPASITRTPGNDSAISRVRSVEWSSTTMISKSTPVCATSDSRQSARQASSLRAGMMTETGGAL